MKRESRADKVIRFIETTCVVGDGVLLGQPFKLAPFQIAFIHDVYNGNASRGYLSTAKKCGKTSLSAALLLAHLVGPEAIEASQIVSGALTRDQASLLFKAASNIVLKSPKLRDKVDIRKSGKKLIGKAMRTEYRALSADGQRNNGLSPVLCIIDEPGGIRGPQSDFVDALVSAQGAYDNALLLAIGTQAPNDADLWSIWIDSALEANDPRVVCHLHAAPKDCALDDREAWAAANPALGMFKMNAALELQATEAMNMPSKEAMFRNYQLNQRVETGSPFVSKSVWDSCKDAPESLEGLEVWGGLDLSTRTDLTSLVLTAKDSAGIWHVKPYFWTPLVGLAERSRLDRVNYEHWRDKGFLTATDGATVDYEVVAKDIADICADLNVQAIAFDPHRIDFLKKEFDRISASVPLVMCHQGFNGVNPGICNLEAELLNGRLRHGGHPVLRMCASGAICETNSEGQRRFSKRKATARIDGIVALAMCFSAAFKAEQPEPKPDYRIYY